MYEHVCIISSLAGFWGLDLHGRGSEVEFCSISPQRACARGS